MTKDELAAIEARVKKVQRDAYIEESEEELWIIVQEDTPALADEIRRSWKEVDELREHQGKVIPGDY